jgi:hypothetical protein
MTFIVAKLALASAIAASPAPATPAAAATVTTVTEIANVATVESASGGGHWCWGNACITGTGGSDAS